MKCVCGVAFSIFPLSLLLAPFASFIVSVLQDGQCPSGKSVCIWSWEFITLSQCPIAFFSEADSELILLISMDLNFYLASALERFLLICSLTSKASTVCEFCCGGKTAALQERARPFL